jgi:hypothetical protein
MRKLALLAVVLSFWACQPFAAEGQSCDSVPCAYGLVCFEEICIVPSTPDAGTPPCDDVSDCSVDGNDDGRQCVEGQCVWDECQLDADCGTRICDRGECTVRETCFDDSTCASGQVCEDEACRDACGSDDECGGFLAVCGSEGRCEQQCFVDLMCLGDLCVDGVCQPPDCGSDSDCDGPGGPYFCNAGRCETYLPCSDDDDCFDPDFRCNGEGRCEERPLCARDADCGLDALCLSGHCRPTATCDVDGDCEDGEECVASRCVPAPACRGNGDCSGDDVCVAGACRAPVATDAASLVLETPHGRCLADGSGACTLVLFDGESAEVHVAALDADGVPVLVDLSATSDSGSVGATAGAGVVTLAASAAGATASIAVSVTGASVSHSALSVRTVSTGATMGNLPVLVVDADSGAPLQNINVAFDNAGALTSADGFVELTGPFVFGGLLTVDNGAVGVALGDIAAAQPVRVALRVPPATPPEPTAAGFTARVQSTGDETGEVSLGLALPSLGHPADASLASLFGDTFFGQLEVPIIGGAPVPLPAAATLSANLPLAGLQVVRDRAFAVTAPGSASVTGFEGVDGTQSVFNFIGNGDALGLALDLATAAEGWDVLWKHAGVLEALPLVEDGDLADDIADVDADGDVTELVPDFGQMPEVGVRPEQLATERVGVTTGPMPPGARGRGFAAAGHWLPGWGFAPTGIGVLPASEAEVTHQIKVHGPDNDALSTARRVVVIEAVYDDARQSVARVEADAFGPALAAGNLIAPPEGAFFVDGIPTPADRTLFLPATAADATTYRVTLIGDGVRWQVVLARGGGGGRTLIVPQALGGVGSTLVTVEALRLPGDDAQAATLGHFSPGAGPRGDLDVAALARALAPAQ